MKAVVFHGVGDIRLEEVPAPGIEQPTDAVVHLTTSAICGTDLHFVRGTLPGMRPGTILGHEGVGVVEQLGGDVRNIAIGDRVVIPATIACGACSFCRRGIYSQCKLANPRGRDAGTAFFGGPEGAGAFHGMQAELVRVPFAHTNLVRIPDGVSDDQAILISDIFPTGYFGAELAGVRPGDTVAVFGCGPVGLFSILSAKLMGAGRVLAIDKHEDRLAGAQAQGAEAIHYEQEDPVEAIMRLTVGAGADRVIDAVGVDAARPHAGPARSRAEAQAPQFAEELRQVAAGQAQSEHEPWQAGDAPSQVLRWAVEAAARAGSIGVIGAYPMAAMTFPVGQAMAKNLAIRMGVCNHLAYMPMLLRMVKTGEVDLDGILTQSEHFTSAIEAFHAFDERHPGWLKVDLRMPGPPMRANPPMTPLSGRPAPQRHAEAGPPPSR